MPGDDWLVDAAPGSDPADGLALAARATHPREEASWDAMTPQEEQFSAAGHAAFQQAAGDRLTGGHEVDRSAAVVSLRPGAAEAVEAVEGPLEQTGRVLSGYYFVQAADREAAVGLARHLRETQVAHSGVEIRQVLLG